MENTYARLIGEHIAEGSLDDINENTLKHAKYLILDSLAVTIGGTQLPQGEQMIEFWSTVGGVGEATVPKSDNELPALTATYVNSYLANLLDYDDTYSGRAIGHPGATVIPPALALGERESVTGETFLHAVIKGYETSIRIGDAIMPTPERSRNVVSTATWQVFGATAAAASLLDMDPNTIAHALGLAGVSAPVPAVRKVGIEEDELHDLKNNYGWASMGGLKAALLADAGFEGNRTIFDGKKGFWRMAASDQFEPDIISEVTSDEWAITDVSFKPYSSCRWSHAALDCLSQLKTQINDRDVASISIDTFYEATTLDGIPNTILDAQFSLPYVVAVHLLDYPTGYEWLQRERITDSQVLDLAKRVSLNQDEEMTDNYEATGQMQAKMTIELTDGSILSASVDHPRGTPENPIQYKSIEKKYETLVEPIIGHEPASELKRHVLNIEQHDLTSITQLMNRIKSPA